MHLTSSLAKHYFKWMVGRLTTRRVPGHQYKGKVRNYRPIIRDDIRNVARAFYSERDSARHLFNPYLTEKEEYPLVAEKLSNPSRITLLEEYPIKPWPNAGKHLYQENLITVPEKSKRWPSEHPADFVWKTPLPN